MDILDKRREVCIPKDSFLITENHPRVNPSSYESGVLDIMILSCSRIDLLEKTLESLVVWFEAHNTFPKERIRFYFLENSPNKSCYDLASSCRDTLGLKGALGVVGVNLGLYLGLRNLWGIGRGEYIWTLEDDWLIEKEADLITGYVDVLESDSLVDTVFMQYPLLDFCNYSEELMTTRGGLQYRYGTHKPDSYWGKWATPVVFRRNIIDSFLKNVLPPTHINPESVLAYVLKDKINTALIEDLSYYPLNHIGWDRTVDVPLFDPKQFVAEEPTTQS